MKIEKLVRITAKSECMDIQVMMTSKKSTAFVRRLNKIHKTSGEEKFSIKIEPVGEILN